MAIINYNDIDGGLLKAIQQAGHNVREVDGVMTSTDDVAVQAIIDSHDYLPNAKKVKIETLKDEAVNRANELYENITTFDEMLLVRDIMLSVAPAARSLTTNIQKLSDIYQAGDQARTDINALTDIDLIRAYDVVNTPTWPV